MNTQALTFTRFIAALGVVVFHYGGEAFPFDHGTLHQLAMNGNIGVSYFFFLSGFVMTIAYGAKAQQGKLKVLHYLQNRFSRIYPLYLFALAFFFWQTHLAWGQEVFNLQTLVNVLLIQAWVPGWELSLNYPGWSLSVEFFLYVTFPFLLRLFLKINNIRALLVTAIVWFITQGISLTGTVSDYHPLIHLSTFMAGMITALTLKQFNESGDRLLHRPLLVSLFALMMLVATFASSGWIIREGHNGLLVPLYGLFVVGLVQNQYFLNRWLSIRPLQFLGEISYGVYILQYPTLMLTQYLNRISGDAMYASKTQEFYLFVALLLILSTGAYYLIELPAKRFIRSL